MPTGRWRPAGVYAFSCLGDAACTSFTWVKDVTSPSYMQCRTYHFNLCGHADLREPTTDTDYCKAPGSALSRTLSRALNITVPAVIAGQVKPIRTTVEQP